MCMWCTHHSIDKLPGVWTHKYIVIWKCNNIYLWLYVTHETKQHRIGHRKQNKLILVLYTAHPIYIAKYTYVGT